LKRKLCLKAQPMTWPKAEEDKSSVKEEEVEEEGGRALPSVSEKVSRRKA